MASTCSAPKVSSCRSEPPSSRRGRAQKHLRSGERSPSSDASSSSPPVRGDGESPAFFSDRTQDDAVLSCGTGQQDLPSLALTGPQSVEDKLCQSTTMLAKKMFDIDCVRAGRRSCGRKTISFRLMMMLSITFVVLVSCGVMQFPMDFFSHHSENGIHLMHGQVGVGQTRLINDLVYEDVPYQEYRLVLRSIHSMVGLYVVDPAREVVDALWSSMKTFRLNDPAWQRPGGDRNNATREMIRWRCWNVLMTQFQWDSGTRNTQPVGEPMWAQPHVFYLHVAWETEEFIDVHFDPVLLFFSDTPGIGLLSAETAGGVEGQAYPVDIFRVDNRTGEKITPPVERIEGYLPTKRPYYLAQSRLHEDALKAPHGPASVPSRGAWSALYRGFFFGGDMGLTWTLPIAYCGNYSCFDGVVSVDVLLKSVSLACHQQWQAIASITARNGMTMTPADSAVFLVNSVARLTEGQEGLLIGASHVVAMLRTVGTKAVDSPQPVVRVTSRALLQRFGSWAASDLVGKEQLFTFRPSMLSTEAGLVECKDNTDCFQVGTTSVILDEDTIWLVVVVLPFGSFAKQASRLAASVESKVMSLHESADKRIEKGRLVSLGISVGMAGASVILGLMIAHLVTRPLRKLGKLMERLGEMDFSHSSPELVELHSGQNSHVREVHKMQQAFCGLSSGIEAFARFVPEKIVRSIVRGDYRMTQLHVHQRITTVMFADIEGSTAIAERISQKDLLFMLTRYFSVMGRIIEQGEGVVAEMLGDGLLVFFNAPGDVVEHQGKACNSAIAMQQGMALVNGEFDLLRLPNLAIRVGVHTGSVLSGNIGSEDKMKFGCLGDAVVLAGCFEALCKRYGVGIICSASTYEALQEDAGFICRRLDLVKATPTITPVDIYEVIGRESVGLNSPALTMCSGSDGARSAVGLGMEDVDLEVGAAPAAAPPPRFGVATAIGLRDPSAVARAALRGSSDALRAQAAAGLFAEPMRRFCRARTSSMRPRLSFWDSALQTPARPNEASTQARARDPPGEVSPGRRARARQYESALQAFLEARFGEARELGSRFLERHPEDRATVRLMERVQEADNHFAGTVPDDWTGALNLSEES